MGPTPPREGTVSRAQGQGGGRHVNAVVRKPEESH